MKKKHELLKYAYDNYPKGCLLDESIRASGDYVIEKVDGGEFLIFDQQVSVILYDSTERIWRHILEEDVPVKVMKDKILKFDNKAPITGGWEDGKRAILEVKRHDGVVFKVGQEIVHKTFGPGKITEFFSDEEGALIVRHTKEGSSNVIIKGKLDDIIAKEQHAKAEEEQIGVVIENATQLAYFKRWLKTTKGIEADYLTWGSSTTKSTITLNASNGVWQNVKHTKVISYGSWYSNYVRDSLGTYRLTSMDNVDIFKGDRFYTVVSMNDEWHVFESVSGVATGELADNGKYIFGKKENAEKFIQEKLKNQLITIFDTSSTSMTITPEQITMRNKGNGDIIVKQLTPTNFKELVDAVNKIANSIK